MKNKTNLSSLSRRLTGTRTSPTSVSRSLSPGSGNSGTSTGLRSESMEAVGKVKGGLRFGSPSQSRAQNSAGSGEWSRLLSQTASGGLASVFGGGGLVSAVSGMGGLVASIAGLFGGGKKTQPPLTLFQLPDSQNQTFTFGGSKSGVSGVAPASTGSYRADQGSLVTTGQSSHDQIYQNQSAQVAQAVKLALLNSSSLNDVIAEI